MNPNINPGTGRSRSGGQQTTALGLIVPRILAMNKAILFTVVLAVALAFASPYFLSSTNLLNILQQGAVLTIVALGSTFVLGAAEIDLSIGSMVALIGVVVAKLMYDFQMPVPWAILCGILTGAACGTLNALFVSKFGLPSFIVTLATNALFLGVLYMATNLIPVSQVPPEFVFLGQGYVGIVPVPVLILLPIAAVMWVLANRTVFGRHVIALGRSAETVRLAGISIHRLRLGVFICSGICCAIAAVILTAISASAQIGAGSDLMLNVIAGVVIGGTPLTGGAMRIVGTVFGCLIIGIINNGLTLLGVNPNFSIIAQGALILLALVLDIQSTKMLLNLGRKQMLQRRSAESTRAKENA